MARCVVGIAGGSASGKSTLAAALAASLGRSHSVALIATDRYMRKQEAGAPTFYSQSMGTTMFDANHPESIAWDRAAQELDALVRQEDGPEIILVEGHLLLNDPGMRERLDVRLFVELDADERALRRLLRDMAGGRANTDPVFIANYYRECARVGHARYIEPSRVYADLVVRGDAEWRRIEPLLVGIVEARLAHPLARTNLASDAA